MCMSLRRGFDGKFSMNSNLMVEDIVRRLCTLSCRLVNAFL